jgi:hypothetical protein
MLGFYQVKPNILGGIEGESQVNFFNLYAP